MYITPAILLARLGAPELVKLVKGRLGKPLNEEVFVAVVDEGDVSSFEDGLVAIAQDAVALIVKAMADVGNTINGYLSKVKTLPLSDEVIAQSPLENIAYALVRYELMLRADDQTQKDHANAMAQLRDIAKGVIQLGAADSEPVSSAKINTGNSCSQFNWGGFGR